jgi:hypothetical protein
LRSVAAGRLLFARLPIKYEALIDCRAAVAMRVHHMIITTDIRDFGGVGGFGFQ